MNRKDEIVNQAEYLERRRNLVIKITPEAQINLNNYEEKKTRPQFQTTNFLFVAVTILVFLAQPSSAWAATFTVTNVSEFQTALDTAAANSEDDTINVTTGTYNATTTLTYHSTEDYSLIIDGEGTDLTVLDGGGTTLVLDITTIASNADVTIRALTVQNGNNTVTDFGGGLRVEVSSSQIKIENSSFTGNRANRIPGSSGFGGGVSAFCTDGSISLVNNTFSGNSATNVGGGATLWTDSGTITLTDNTFNDNSITTAGPVQPGYDGGGVSAQTLTGEITLTGNVFTNNTSGDDGGGAFTYSTGSGSVITLTDNDFTGNTAVLNGGGYYNHFTLEGTLTLSNNTFTDNHVNIGSGGGAHLDVINGSVTIANNSFVTNETFGTATGGGLEVQTTNASIALMSNTFSGNESGTHGGGAYLTSDTGEIDAVNNLFNHNTAGESGGGISVATGTDRLTLRNNTISDNSATDGGGVSFYSDEDIELEIFNSILWHDIPNEIVNLGGNGTITVNASDVDGGFEGEGNIDADPKFINPDNGNYYLQAGSPCLSTANCEGAPETDQDGQLRPLGNGCDMGCYEQCNEGLIYGDVSRDCRITAFDAYLALNYVVGLANLPALEIEAADVTDNNTITALDAALILQYSVSLIRQFPVQQLAPIVTAKDENQILTKIIVELEHVFLTREQKQVLEQLKRLIGPQLLPRHTALLQNYPNPFNPETWIPFQLADDTPVTISIYNTKGQLIFTISLGNKKAGIYTTKDKAVYWGGRDKLGEKVASGIYYYQLQAGEFRETRKMVIVK